MNSFKTKLADWLDPYRQSFFFFKWTFTALLVVVAGSILITVCWRSGFVKLLLDNIFVYLPNYLTHEMAGHNLVGNIFYRAFYFSHRELGIWIATLAGNGIETLIPFLVCFFCLRIEGGRWTLPPVLYWLSTTFYGAGVYAQDARACSLALTSSDMVTNWAPGERCGDWHDILEPLGLLNYDQVVAYTFFVIGSVVFMLAVYSAWYYWTHPNFYAGLRTPKPDPEPAAGWQPPNIYEPQQPAATGAQTPLRREYTPNGHDDHSAGGTDFPGGMPRL